jgi:hypothetical protein
LTALRCIPQHVQNYVYSDMLSLHPSDLEERLALEAPSPAPPSAPKLAVNWEEDETGGLRVMQAMLLVVDTKIM